MAKKLPATPETAYLQQHVHDKLAELLQEYGGSKSHIINRAVVLMYDVMQIEKKRREEVFQLLQGNSSANDRRKNRRR